MEKHQEFTSPEALRDAAKQEAIVCGDEVREKEEGAIIEIFNWHAGEVRWKGVVTKKVGQWYEELSKEEGGPFSGACLGETTQKPRRPYSDAFYKQTGFMREDE